jgi:RimJ/RimL family protein N-acetyltransferase
MDGEGWPRTIVLRAGEEVRVRPMVPADAPTMVQFFRDLPPEDRLFLRNDVTRPDVVERFVRNEEHVLALVAEQHGRIVASATLQRERYGWMTHVGELRLVLARTVQHHGLGTALVRILVKAAVSAGIDKIIALVMDGQVAAEKGIEHLGFRREAVLKGQVRDVSGKRRDLLMYSNDVEHIWDTMELLVADAPHLGG